MRIVTDIVIGMFIVFIMLPFILLCALLIIYELLKIFQILKEEFQEILDGKER